MAFQIFTTYYELPNGTIQNATARTTYEAKPLPVEEWKELNLLTLIFSPPFAGPPSQVFHAFISNLVSHGYSVVTMDHPYEQPYLQLPDGTGIPGLPVDHDINTEEGLEFVQRVHNYRLTDAHAVLKALPSLRNAYRYHSNSRTSLSSATRSVALKHLARYFMNVIVQPDTSIRSSAPSIWTEVSGTRLLQTTHPQTYAYTA